MSGVGFTMDTGEVSLSAATAKTVIGLLAASNHRVHITEIGIWFKGTTVTNEPVTVEFTRWTSDGTGTSGTVRATDPDASETPEVSFKYNYSVEPTTPTVLKTKAIHPQAGIEIQYPIERPIEIHGGDYWGIECTADDAVTVIISLEGNE